MNVLVTGATGFLGKALALRLADEGHRVYCLARNPKKLSKELLEKCITPVLGDVTDSLFEKNLPEQIDRVFHLAGLVAYKRKDRPEMEQVNVQGTQHIVDVCVRRKIKLLHTSSVVAVGASRTPTVLNETAKYDVPEHFGYFATKKKAEDLVMAAVRDRGLQAVTVNPSTVYGPEDALKGSRKMQLKVAAGKLPFYPPGGVSIVDVDDVVEGMLLAMQKGRVGERYILSGENLLIRDVFRQIASAAGVRAPRFALPRGLMMALGTAGDLLERCGASMSLTSENAAIACWYHWFDSSKAQKELGFHFRPAHESLERSVRWAQNHLLSTSSSLLS